ncbi:MAG TPA: MBL fold metallo-hydrolase [Longimicrobiaceae bacterium]|nr:MBL fold metallo-hydrolase [Longimicrobiaceae bacterium]
MSELPAPDAVGEGVWRVTTPLPFRPRRVHAYLAALGGGGWLLVDGGANTDDAWAALDDGVRRTAGGWGGVRLHLVTHMHLDHVGLAERVRAASGAPLAEGRLDAERAAHAHAHPEEEFEYRGSLLEEGGVPEPLRAPMQGSRGGANPLSSFVPADHLLPEDTSPLPDAPEWNVVWTPGHTAGHVSVFRESDGLLLAGDAVLPRVTPTIGVNRQRADPVGDYLDALGRLRALRPARAAAGHGTVMEDVETRLNELAAATEAESAAVAGLLSTEPATAWELARARYPDRELPHSVWMHALRETLAHLRHLAAAGRAGEERRGGVAAFRRR